MFHRNRKFYDLVKEDGAGAGTGNAELAKALTDTTAALITVKDALAKANTRIDEEAAQRKREIDALNESMKAKAGLPGYAPTGNPDKDFSLARAILGAHKKWEGETKQFPEYEMVHDYQAHVKAQSGDVSSAGGFLVSSTFMAGKLIEELLAEPVALAAGVDQMTGLTGGDVVIPGELGGITVARGAELSTISEGTELYKDFTLRRKQIQGLAGLSISLMKQTNGMAMQYVERKLAKKIALKMDLDFFVGAGSENTPLGIINAPNAQSVSFSSIDYAGADQNVTDLLDAMLFKLRTANAYKGKPTFFCHPGGTQKLRTVKDANGNPILYRAVDLNGRDAALSANNALGNGYVGTLWGHPLYETTQLTGSGAGSHLILANVQDCVWALWDTLEIAVSEHVNFNTGKVAVRVLGWQDSGVYRGASVVNATSWTI